MAELKLLQDSEASREESERSAWRSLISFPSRRNVKSWFVSQYRGEDGWMMYKKLSSHRTLRRTSAVFDPLIRLMSYD